MRYLAPMPTPQPIARTSTPAADALLGLYFPVLDHGFVALVDYMGDDEAIERAARVSVGPDARQVHDRRNLLRYLKRHKHTTPFEMVELKFHCAMPMFIARQWIRHRTASVNEVSGRYTELPALFYTPTHEDTKLQSKVMRQGRSEDSVSDVVYDMMRALWAEERQTVKGTYQYALGVGIANEIARIDLPLSTYTQWYWKIDLHNLMHFLGLRVDAHAQKEIRDFARIMAGMAQVVAPLAFEAWRDYDYQGSRFSRVEMQAMSALFANLANPSLSPEEAANNVGLSKREVAEFCAKLSKSNEPESFDLDLSRAVEGAVMQRKYNIKKETEK